MPESYSWDVMVVYRLGLVGGRRAMGCFASEWP